MSITAVLLAVSEADQASLALAPKMAGKAGGPGSSSDPRASGVLGHGQGLRMMWAKLWNL